MWRPLNTAKRWLAGPPRVGPGPLRVAVVTPYCDEPLDVLSQCHESVRAQSHPCLHVMVADGNPRNEVRSWSADHIILPRPHNDFGSAARLIGCLHAIGAGCNALAFLDADNWYDPAHISTLAELYRATGAGFLASSRQLCRLDGSVVGPCTKTDIRRFIDTSCMMFTPSAFPILSHWVRMPDYGHVIGDRILLYHIGEAGIRRAFSGKPTLFFRASREGFYRSIGEPAPAGARPSPDYRSAFMRWIDDGHPPLA